MGLDDGWMTEGYVGNDRQAVSEGCTRDGICAKISVRVLPRLQLMQTFVENDACRSRQIQTANLSRQDRYLVTLLGVALQHLRRKAARLGAEEQGIAGAERNLCIR